MRITHEQLIGLPVYTQSRQDLGRVAGFEMDTEQQVIRTYVVKKSALLKELFAQAKYLYISNSQVVSLTDEEMVVIDSVAAEAEKKQTSKKAIPA